MKKNLSILAILCVIGTFTNLEAQGINMNWVLMDTLPADLDAGSCANLTDCSGPYNIICYALTFTPTFIDEMTGVMSSEDSLLFTSYTTFFEMDCAANDMTSIFYNESCIMLDNSDSLNVCPMLGQRFNSSGNGGTEFVYPDSTYVIHEVCFFVPDGDTLEINIRTGAVQSNAGLGVMMNAITENLDVADLVIDADEVCMEDAEITVDKYIEDGPNPTMMMDQYEVIYNIVVNNIGSAVAMYDLGDTLYYGDGAIIDMATASYLGGDGLSGMDDFANFDGQTMHEIVGGESVGVGESDTFQIVVLFTVDPGMVTDESQDCDLMTGSGTNSGLLNVTEVQLVPGGQISRDSACAEIPLCDTLIVSDTAICSNTPLDLSGFVVGTNITFHTTKTGAETAGGMTDLATNPNSYSDTTTIYVRDTSESGCVQIDSVLIEVELDDTEVDAGPDFSVCLRPDDMSFEISVVTNAPGMWTGGLGVFDDVASDTTNYTPATSEIGQTVTLSWLSEPGGLCPRKSDSVDVTIRGVNCGTFPWDGN